MVKMDVNSGWAGIAIWPNVESDGWANVGPTLSTTVGIL